MKGQPTIGDPISALASSALLVLPVHIQRQKPLRKRPSLKAVDGSSPVRSINLLAQRDAQLEALNEFVAWAADEWGEPSAEAKARTDEIWSNR